MPNDPTPSIPPPPPSVPPTATAGSAAPLAVPPTNFDLVKFLVERAHAEGQIFWIRNSVFLTVHAVGLAWVLQGTDKVGELAGLTVVVSGIFGVVLAIIWHRITFLGRKLNHAWLQDAKDIVCLDHRLRAAFRLSLSKDGSTTSQAASVKTLLGDRRDPAAKSPSHSMYFLAEVFGLVWILVIVAGANILLVAIG